MTRWKNGGPINHSYHLHLSPSLDLYIYVIFLKDFSLVYSSASVEERNGQGIS